MKRRIFLSSAAGAAVGGFLSLAHAETAPPTRPEAPVEGIRLLPSVAPRIADIAPQFAFLGSDKKLWSVSGLRGKSPVILILTGDAPILVSERATPE